jgi:hypothetical protein
MREVVRKEVLELLHTRISYPVPYSEWVSHVHVVLKKGGITIVENDKNELIPQCIIIGWQMCIVIKNLTRLQRKITSHYPSLTRCWNSLQSTPSFVSLMGIPDINKSRSTPEDQSKTTFICPYGTYAYQRMLFGLCNALASFQECMMSIFSDIIKKFMDVFMDDFPIYDTTFDDCLDTLDKVLQRCK